MYSPLPLNVICRRVLGMARTAIAAEIEQRRAQAEAAENAEAAKEGPGTEANQVVSPFSNILTEYVPICVICF
jgi:hypothetical protein